MKVSEYRDVIGSLSDALGDVHAAVGQNELRFAAERLARNLEDVKSSVCSRASDRDRIRTSSLIAQAETWLAEFTPNFKAADASFQKMAFGVEYR